QTQRGSNVPRHWLRRRRQCTQTLRTTIPPMVRKPGGRCSMTIDSERSAEEIAADFNRSEEELVAEFKRRFDDGLTPDERLIQQGISEGYELRDKEFREAAQKHRSGKDKR